MTEVKRWVDYYGGIRFCEIGLHGELSYHGIGTCYDNDAPELTDEQRRAVGWETAEEAVAAIRFRLLANIVEEKSVLAWLKDQVKRVERDIAVMESREANLEKEVVPT